MAGEKIEVNKEVLEEEIINLTKLINDIESSGIKALEIDGAGYTKELLNKVEYDIVSLLNAFKYLADATVACLTNVKNGYVEIDENTRDAIETFRNEVLS